MILNKKTIWLKEGAMPDTYADFVADFSVNKGSKVELNIACNGHYAVYINGELVKFASSSDYPWYRVFDKIDISSRCGTNNKILVSVWYPGVDSQTYIKDEAGVFFSIEENGVTIYESNANTKSRKNINYKNGYLKTITYQLGMSFCYNSCINNNLEYENSIESVSTREFNLRKNAALILGKRVKTRVKEIDNGYLIDLGEEQVGFVDLDFTSSISQTIKILYAEHLVEGEVQHIIGNRDFSLEYIAKKGDNQYMNPFRRIACRYIQLVCETPIDIKYVGLRTTNKRISEKRVTFNDVQLQKIYDVSVNTLKKCMHEHYEDCPWREQAMYSLDSRNQMLCGYYAFKGYRYQKENLLFMAKGQREDGLLSLCFPAGIDIPIPFFSLVYLMQVKDYVEHSCDFSVIRELKPVLDRIIAVFESKIDESGLIPNFPYPYWNFYEWSVESNNESEITRSANEPYKLQYDLILNAMYVYARKIYNTFYGVDSSINGTIDAIHKTFYDSDRGVYRLSTVTEKSSQLSNSMALLIGLGNRDLAGKLVNDDKLIKVTLSMNTFYYDALLSIDKHLYSNFIVEDIKKKYGMMLNEGATTFWETEKGWRDFDNAGSLCHGWSAIPAYYLPYLLQ